MTWKQVSRSTIGTRLLRVGALCMFVLASSLTAIAKGNPETFFNALLQDDQVSPLNQAFAALWLGEDLPRANALLRDAFDAAIGDAEALTPDVADATFKWQMRTWIRVYYLFGHDDAKFGARLDSENRERVEELFWNYGVAKSSLARADLSYVWFIQGSENHDLMDLGNAFLALQAVAGLPAYRDQLLPDSGAPREHVKAWTGYFRRYCDERIRNGLFIEVGSPTYGKYLVPELVNISEFADDEALRETATNLLHLMWADWAIEQLNGVRGGAKARCYQGNYSRNGHADSWWQMGQYLLTEGDWTNTGISRHPIHGFNLCLASSTYELPDVVRELAADPEARGEYAYISRRLGKMKPLDTLPPLGGHPCWYSMDPEDTRLVRYTWCTPDHIMGCFLSDPTMREDFIVSVDEPERAANRYAAIHGQNRWQGIVFATDPDARIFPQCEGTPDEKKPGLSTTYVQQVAVQHENVMLVQMNRANPKNTAMRIYFAPGMRDRIAMRDGWRIIEEGNSFAAVKLLSREDGQIVEEADWDERGFLRPKDPYAPVIFVTGRKNRFENVDRFMVYLAAHAYDVSEGKLTYGFTDSLDTRVELGLDLNEPRISTKNGEPIDLNPEKAYDSPYVMSDTQNDRVSIAFAGQELSVPTSANAQQAKPRVIATTDGEVDDRCSMIRFLLYANEWDIRGLIHSSSKYHWKGDDEHPEHDWEPVTWLDRQLDAYAEVYPNLTKHDPDYPSPEYLRSQVFVGNIALEGDLHAPTPGSNRIVDVLLEPDDSPVWLQAWGGSNTIARALKTIQEEHPDRVEEVAAKTRIYLITEQDNTLKTYLRPEWPGIQILRSGGPSFGAIAYAWQKMQPEDIQASFDRDWMTANILDGHGPLCAMYEAKEGRFRSEGDTPAFLHTIDTGLRSMEHPSYGGWGGRFALSNNVWKSVDTEDSSPHSILRWAKDFQNDWASRADWCVTDYANANHPPKVSLTRPLERTGTPGQPLALDVSASTDPDGDALTYRWWHFSEVGTYRNTVLIDHSDQPAATLTIPDDAKPGDVLHIICSVTDSGMPPLTRYARVILEVRE